MATYRRWAYHTTYELLDLLREYGENSHSCERHPLFWMEDCWFWVDRIFDILDELSTRREN